MDLNSWEGADSKTFWDILSCRFIWNSSTSVTKQWSLSGKRRWRKESKILLIKSYSYLPYCGVVVLAHIRGLQKGNCVSLGKSLIHFSMGRDSASAAIISVQQHSWGLPHPGLQPLPGCPEAIAVTWLHHLSHFRNAWGEATSSEAAGFTPRLTAEVVGRFFSCCFHSQSQQSWHSAGSEGSHFGKPTKTDCGWWVGKPAHHRHSQYRHTG